MNDERAEIIDGFAAAVTASRHSALYSDYRGDSPAWWEALEDPNGARMRNLVRHVCLTQKTLA